ncbi:MAG TPA: transcriptional regulator [Kofleriaceae bacterium]|jgi:DNA-binding winged helix-turn-helix (wHTH) protein/tetratricopeptide (TPR) repeat protein|nr:transcriptional regulator [Kofleriaceae bacterium]
MPARAYRFGTFRLDIDRRELWRADACVSLQPKVFDCLAYLIEHRDAAVSRDELIGAVWGRADVTDNVLGQIIARARHAVDDTGDEQRAIRTVVRFGYRWVAAVEPITEATEAPMANEPAGPVAPAGVPATEVSAPAVVERVAPRRQLPRQLPVILIAGALFAGVAGWGLLRVQRTGAPAPSARAADGAAVILPVTVVAVGDFAWIRLGIMDLVAERLREAGQPVMPSDSVVAWVRNFADRSPGADDITELAETIGARWVTQARAELVGDHWRVSLHTLYGPSLTTEGEDRDVLVAARAAADRLAAEIGLVPPSDALPATADGAAVVQRAKAAILANQLEEARALLDGASRELQDQPEVRYQRARIELLSGRFDQARTGFAALTTGLLGGRDPLLRADALYGLGVSEMRQSMYGAAEASFAAAVALLDGRKEPRARSILGRVFNSSGGIHVQQHRFELARGELARARMTLQGVGDPVTLASVDNNSGVLAKSQGRPAEALPFFEHAAERARSTRDVATELRARVNASECQLALLDPAAALAGDARVHELVAAVADPRLRQFASAMRVHALAASGQMTAARQLVRELRDREPEVRDGPMAALVEGMAAEVADSPDEVVRAARASLAATGQDGPKYVRAWLLLFRAERAAGHAEAAARAVTEAASWAERERTPEANVYAALLRAEQAAVDGATAARAAFEQALALADAGSVPDHVLQVASAYAAYLIGGREQTALAAVAGRVAAWAPRDYEAALLQLRVHRATGDVDAWRSTRALAHVLAGERELPAELAAPITPKPRD